MHFMVYSSSGLISLVSEIAWKHNVLLCIPAPHVQVQLPLPYQNKLKGIKIHFFHTTRTMFVPINCIWTVKSFVDFGEKQVEHLFFFGGQSNSGTQVRTLSVLF